MSKQINMIIDFHHYTYYDSANIEEKIREPNDSLKKLINMYPNGC
jgi:hypothetical protein